MLATLRKENVKNLFLVYLLLMSVLVFQSQLFGCSISHCLTVCCYNKYSYLYHVLICSNSTITTKYRPYGEVLLKLNHYLRKLMFFYVILLSGYGGSIYPSLFLKL